MSRPSKRPSWNASDLKEIVKEANEILDATREVVERVHRDSPSPTPPKKVSASAATPPPPPPPRYKVSNSPAPPPSRAAYLPPEPTRS